METGPNQEMAASIAYPSHYSSLPIQNSLFVSLRLELVLYLLHCPSKIEFVLKPDHGNDIGEQKMRPNFWKKSKNAPIDSCSTSPFSSPQWTSGIAQEPHESTGRPETPLRRHHCEERLEA